MLQQEPQNTEYRSYLTKDKKKFSSAIDKVSKGDYDTSAYRLYRSSPQEIAAFAHEAALKLVNNIDLGQIDDFPYLRNTINQDMQWYMDDQFSDPKNPEEYKIFKRFHKLMYQEVIRTIDRAEKEFNKKKKSNTEEY